jgi:hypothetical protein
MTDPGAAEVHIALVWILESAQIQTKVPVTKSYTSQINGSLTKLFGRRCLYPVSGSARVQVWMKLLVLTSLSSALTGFVIIGENAQYRLRRLGGHDGYLGSQWSCRRRTEKTASGAKLFFHHSFKIHGVISTVSEQRSEYRYHSHAE